MVSKIPRAFNNLDTFNQYVLKLVENYKNELNIQLFTTK